MYRIFALALCLSLTTAGLGVEAQTPTTVSVTPQTPQTLAVVIEQSPERGTRTIIRGNALTATNAALPDAIVRLRDARSGRIVDREITDDAGLFEFKPVDPGTYIVELLGNDQRVIAASQLLNGQAGDLISALVKMPWQGAGGLMGHGLASLIAVSSAAVASGVLARTVTGKPVSGEK